VLRRALSSNFSTAYCFCLNYLKSWASSSNEISRSALHLNTVGIVLRCLCSFLRWAPISQVFQKDNELELVKLLLLTDDCFKSCTWDVDSLKVVSLEILNEMVALADSSNSAEYVRPYLVSLFNMLCFKIDNTVLSNGIPLNNLEDFNKG
jgi:hypothetical protein